MTIWKPDISKLEGPRYIAIANAIETDIKNGRIAPGFKLPTHRELADILNVTVGTITRGYAEAAQRGLLRGETGRGTYVAGSINEDSFHHHEDTPQDAVDMGMSLPLNHLDPNMQQTFKALSEDSDLQNTLHYYPSKGRYTDRETGSEWLKNHYLDVSAKEIVITAGGQHAITTVLTTLFRPGDSIAVESITYPLFKSLARRFFLKLTPIDTDKEGMIPDHLNSACKTQNIKAVYCMPTCHNPTTACMSDKRRQQIALTAQQNDLFIIEDDAYSLLNTQPFNPIYKYAPERTFYIASLSKPVTSGLRFGYLVCPDSYQKRIELSIADTMWMASPVSAKIAKHWIENGIAKQTILSKKEESRKRNQITHDILKEQNYSSQETGYFIWLKLPEPWNATDFSRQTSEHKVIVSPDQLFQVGRPQLTQNAVRVAISGPTTHEELRNGLRIIKKLLNNEESYQYTE